MGKISIMLALLATQTFAIEQYRRDVREAFQKRGYLMAAFNEESWIMFSKENTKSKIVNFKIVEIFDDHYLVEYGKADCRHRLTSASDQYESWNGGDEKHYIVDSPMEPFKYATLQAYEYEFACINK